MARMSPTEFDARSAGGGESLAEISGNLHDRDTPLVVFAVQPTQRGSRCDDNNPAGVFSVFLEAEIEMRLQHARTAAIALLGAFVAAGALAPAEAAPRAHHKKVQPWHGWGTRSI